MTRDGRRVTGLKYVDAFKPFPLIGTISGATTRLERWGDSGQYATHSEAPRVHPLDLIRDADPTPDEEGWIPWGGGECPVADGVMVQIRNHSGPSDPKGKPAAFWGGKGGREKDWWATPGLITHYRLVQSPEAKPSGPVRYKQVPVVEIVPGAYGILRVGQFGASMIPIGLAFNPENMMRYYRPDELIAAGETLIALGKAGKEMGE